MPNSKQIVYLSQSQYAELIANGTITVDGVTVTYDENDIYVTPQAEPVTDVRINGTSIAANGVANISNGGYGTYGVMKLHTNVGNDGLKIDNGNLAIYAAFGSDMKQGRQVGRPITPSTQDSATFYGLAKAAGDTTQAASDNEVGNYTTAAKNAIQTMLDVPAKADIPSVPVQDVQVNGVSVLSEGVANVPIASSSAFGVFKTGSTTGTGLYLNPTSGMLFTSPASTDELKAGTNSNRPVVSSNGYVSAFYGLAKAAGDTTQASSDNEVGSYTAEAKSAIQTMLGIPKKVSDLTDDSGHYTKPASGIPASDLASGVIPTVPVQDVQVNGASILDAQGVANVPKASTSVFGATCIMSSGGINLNSESKIYISAASEAHIKAGTGTYLPITSPRQHLSVFYGLAKAAGDTTQASSENAVGTYTSEAKAAIKTMLGIPTMTDIITAVHNSYPAAEGVGF